MFSELGGITAETGLSFSGEHGALYGTLHGFGVTVTDRDGRYTADIFCEKPSDSSADISALISELGESLPKNALISQSCGIETVTAELDKYSLLQENVIYLIGFLDKLTEGLAGLGIAGKEYRFFAEQKPSGTVSDGEGDRVKLGFDLRSILGILGALLGAAAMTVIAVLLVDVRAEANAFGLSTEVSAYILSGITALVVFADYRFLARKLDACGVILCPVLSVIAVVLSGLGAGVKACAAGFGVSFIQALSRFPEFLAQSGDTDKFLMGYITRGTVLAAVLSIAFCVYYFSRHPDETIRSEKVVSRDENPLGIRRR